MGVYHPASSLELFLDSHNVTLSSYLSFLCHPVRLDWDPGGNSPPGGQKPFPGPPWGGL